MRVGLLTSGGDCQALNPTMRGVVLTLKNLAKKVEIIGFAITTTVLCHHQLL